MSRSKVRVACIQTNNAQNKTAQQNLDAVTNLIQDAVESGAKLILFPELMPNEYFFGTSSWDFAETLNDSATLKFISQQSIKYNIYIGLSFMEAEGLHFYNTFIMTDPQGQLIAKIRKTRPAGLEAFFFHGYDNKHVINTKDFGNILVGICYENHLSPFENELISHQNSANKNDRISLILQPHSCPYMKGGIGLSEEVIQIMHRVNNLFDNIAILYARKYNIPVLFCNKTGPFRMEFLNMHGRFDYIDTMGAWTKIVNSNGMTVTECQHKREDGVNELIVGDIDLNEYENQRCYEIIDGVWSSCAPFDKGIALTFSIEEFMGKVYYNCSIKRRMKASMITGHGWMASVSMHIAWFCSGLYIVYRAKKLC